MAKKNSQNNNYPKNLKELQSKQFELEKLEMFLIEKSLNSNSPQAYIEAQSYIKGIEEKKKNNLRSFTYSPTLPYFSGQGYKYKPQGLSSELLRVMSNTPQIRAIINTRIEQAENFGDFRIDNQVPGWTVAKKKGLFDTGDKELTNKEKQEIEYVVKFLESGGTGDGWNFEGWETFTRKLYNDSWSLDQGVFEVAIDRTGKPISFECYDGGTFYIAEHNEHNANLDAYKINGYLPRYVQVFGNVKQNEYYPWELCFGVRNASSSIHLNGYGLSEMEVLIQVITWMLNSNQYNGNFFQQGSNPKGILNFKDNVSDETLNGFKQNWRNTLSGTNNSHKLAAISGGNLEWINMQLTNRDMEFNEWNQFLTIIACTVFRIDPSEVGFNVGVGNSVFGQDGQKERLRHSKEKGLEPFLKFWQRKITKYLVAPLTGGKYEFKFTGIEPDDEDAALEKDIKVLSSGGMSVQDFFMKYSGRELDTNKDMLLNSIALQYKQMQQNGTPEANQSVDEYSDESYNNPYTQEPLQDKSEKSDPFNKSLNLYLDKFIKENHKS
jgi:hypothetical protein